MLKIKEIKAKTIITKTQLPEGDFVINPYIGCMHGCKYCYARFMKRFTGHTEPWGAFVDAKINAPDLVPTDIDEYKGKFITIGSVTDAYQPVELKYKLTRQILEKLIPLQPHLDIMTKSDLVLRDIDIIKQFKDCVVAFSLLTLNDAVRKELEPLASSIERRIAALEKLHKAGIPTVVFISPIFPELTDWKEIINRTKSFVDQYWFENLNLYPSIRGEVYGFLKKYNPTLINKYEQIYIDDSYWAAEEQKIREFCKKNKLNYRIYFHHKRRDSAHCALHNKT
jgi:DNA repair photolyase